MIYSSRDAIDAIDAIDKRSVADVPVFVTEAVIDVDDRERIGTWEI